MTKERQSLCISFPNYFKPQNFAITLGAQSTPKEVFMEISNYMDFQFLIRFLEGLQKFLGDNCEIIVHDYRKGYDHTIV